MVNYKPRHLDYISIGGINHFLQEGETLRTLHYQIGAVDAPQSLTDSHTYSNNYVVPTGKTYHSVGFILVSNATGGIGYWYQSDTADAETTAKQVVRLPTIIGTHERATEMTFASAKYITFDPNSTAIYDVYLYGYEKDN